MKNVSRASRPGLLVGFIRILCNGLCTARRFHTPELDHTCRIGCPDELDSLTHYSECPRLYNTFLETCYDIATEKSFFTWLDHPCITAKPAIWHCGCGLSWCICLCPSWAPRGRIYVMFGPVITTEAHLAFSGARIHSNNTAELTAMIEALSFLGLRGPVTRDEQSRIFTILCMLLVLVWALFKLVRMCS